MERYCVLPNKKIVNNCKANDIPTICFPKGLKENYTEFIKQVLPDGINIDYDIKPEWAADNFKRNLYSRRNGSKNSYKTRRKKILHTVDKYLEVFHNCPYIFNLGHGILPETDPELIKKITERVKKNDG